ncbi:TIGR02206 family membrane protein [Paenibacillus mesophilus]|uniref:YwaF family protein n=1 Tax=Paenibacillus mesophilus TaxID=2582849 RepID=UPI00110DDC2F|nr:TIGR02206 family membrane protein [Paenibacillus mesophilus]TMV48467.1 TIGR02206 family membrane protein [Paenibacillus mesophilus]
MNRFFDADSPNVFTAYSLTHMIALAVFVAAVVLLYISRHWLRQGRRSRYGRYALAALLIASEVSLNAWYVAENVYDVKYTLPLELCSLSLYLSIAMLFLRSRFVFQIVYFAGIGGAIQALLTPVLYYDFPHFVYFEFFAAHIAIILSPLYMVWMEGFRPTLKSIFVTLGFLNVMLVIVFFVNTATGGNYMFVASKPETASLLDFLGPYPWYLLSMEAVALVIFLLLYWPFAARASATKRKSSG